MWCCCKQGKGAELAQPHPALPVCTASTSGICCTGSALTGEESDCEERRAGKGMRICHLMLKNSYSEMALMTAAWRVNG